MYINDHEILRLLESLTMMEAAAMEILEVLDLERDSFRAAIERGREYDVPPGGATQR